MLLYTGPNSERTRIMYRNIVNFSKQIILDSSDIQIEKLTGYD
ncbi:MAG: hypothetical protein ACPL7I_02095 [Myxococcota bacterium]